MAVGGGFNSLQESMSVIGVPVMMKQSFIDIYRASNWKTVVDCLGGVNVSCRKGIAIKMNNTIREYRLSQWRMVQTYT